MYINVELIYNNTYNFIQFTYKVPNNLLNDISIGSIVEVNFRNNKYYAVVVETDVKLSTNIKINEVKKILYCLSKKQIDYLQILAISNYLNVGILLSNIFNIETFKNQNKLNSNKYKLSQISNLKDNVSDKHKNIFVVPTLEHCMKLYKKLKNDNISIDFVQKTGGKSEIKSVLSKDLEYKNIIILSNNFNYLEIKDDYIFHFYDTNNIAFNLPKLNSMNIVEAAVYKNMIFGGNFIFYNNFPALDIFNSIEHVNNIHLNNNVNYLFGNNLQDCVNLFKNKFDKKAVQLFTFSKTVQDKLSEFQFSNNFDDKDNNMFILFNPKISYNKTLNSIRLISLLKQLNYCAKNNIEVTMISTKEESLKDMFSIDNINKLASKELQERVDYGPNIDIKIYSFRTKDQYQTDGFESYILGPRINNEFYEYEIRLFLRNNINYNKIMSLFSDVSKFEPIN